MSFGAELIGFSLALGTNDVVVTDKRSIVAWRAICTRHSAVEFTHAARRALAAEYFTIIQGS